MKVNIFWFRRDLRLEDNAGLFQALSAGLPVIPVFIFDTNILDELPKTDPRVSFIYDCLSIINKTLNNHNSALSIFHGTPEHVIERLIKEHDVHSVYTNRDYEPYAIKRDSNVQSLLLEQGIQFQAFKDHVIFEKDEITKRDGSPYTIYTPYKNRWIESLLSRQSIDSYECHGVLQNFLKTQDSIPGLEELGFSRSQVPISKFDHTRIVDYSKFRDIPHLDHTTHIGPHLRFGTISIRKVVKYAYEADKVFLSELVWREFFIMILYHFPHVVDKSFKPKYDNIEWLNDKTLFEAWCIGQTGYPMVDAGMKQLNETGFMHNRVRMVVASFLCKHLLIDWRWGEAYFAKRLLDYELASNNGNWQWAAGCGCDAAPYFRVFNPTTQLLKFDPELKYVKRWLPEHQDTGYSPPIVEHKFARDRAINTYKAVLG